MTDRPLPSAGAMDEASSDTSAAASAGMPDGGAA